MSFNPLMLAKLKPMHTKFKREHADFLAELKAAAANNLKEGSVVSIGITAPDGDNVTVEMDVSAEDETLIRQIREMFS